MTAVIVAIAFCGWLAGIAEWLRANCEQDRADRAETFAQDALDELFRATADRDKWRAKYHGEVGRLIDEVHAEDTPIANSVDFDLWQSEVEGR